MEVYALVLLMMLFTNIMLGCDVKIALCRIFAISLYNIYITND